MNLTTSEWRNGAVYEPLKHAKVAAELKLLEMFEKASRDEMGTERFVRSVGGLNCTEGLGNKPLATRWTPEDFSAQGSERGVCARFLAGKGWLTFRL